MSLALKQEIIKNRPELFLKNNELLLLDKKTKDYLNENKKRKEFIKTLKKVSEVFKKKKGWCIIKIKEIPKAHSDVDIFVTSHKLLKLKNILLKNKYHFVRDFGQGNLTFSKGKDNIKVDLQIGLNYPNVITKINYVNPLKVIKRSKRKQLEGMTFPYTSEEDDFLIFSAHSIFSNDTTQDYGGNSTFNLSDIYQLHVDSRKKNFDWDYVLKTSKEHHWAEGVYYAIKITNKTFPSNSLKRGQEIFEKEISERMKKKIDSYLDKDITFPHIISRAILLEMCFKKAIKDKSIKSFFAYLRWFLHNKLLVLLAKRIRK